MIETSNRVPFESNLRRFLLVWIGHVLTMLTMALTEFALGVWIYQHSGSMTKYTTVILFALVPGMLIAPWAGSIVDRFDRRKIIIIADLSYLLSTLALGLLLWWGQLELWHICVSNILGSMCLAFSAPAYIAATSMLVPKEHLGRFSGLRQMAQSLSHILAPVLAGLIMSKLGLPFLIALNIPSFAFAIFALLLLHFPERDETEVTETFSLRVALADIRLALDFIKERTMLLTLVVYSATLGFIFSLATALLVPMILALHTEVQLGTILSFGGVGTLVGSSLMALRSANKHLVLGLIVFDLIFGLSLMVTGMATSVPALSALVFVSMLCSPLALGFDQTLWQKKVPIEMQGRVFSLKGILMSGALPLATLAGGILSDKIFEPAMMPDAWLAGVFGPWIGTGKGRGIGVIFILAGAVAAALSVLALLRPSLRRLDRELPDAY